MTPQQKRYCSLDGDPVHMTFSDTLRTLPDYKVAGLAAVFNLCVTAANAGPEGLALSVLGSAGGLVVGKGVSDFYDWLMLRLKFGRHFRDMAVDMSPDGRTPPTKPEHLKAARDVRDYSFLMTLGIGNKWLLIGSMGLAAAFGAVSPPDIISSHKFQFGMGFLGTAAAFVATHFARATARNHRVYKKRWAVVDMPPPQEQEETEKTPGFNPVPQGLTSSVRHTAQAYQPRG